MLSDAAGAADGDKLSGQKRDEALLFIEQRGEKKDLDFGVLSILFIPQGIDRIQAGGLEGRVIAEKDTHGGGKRKRDQQGPN